MSDTKGSESVVLRDFRDSRGHRFLEATRREDGGIAIDGQDLGDGVEEAFGAGLTEYEWAWRIEPQDVPAAVAALGGHEADDPMRVLEAWFSGHGGKDPGSHLKDAGVPIGFWSHVGD